MKKDQVPGQARNDILKNILAAGFILVLGLLSFLYRFITNFPIGDDPAVHVRVVKVSTYAELLNYNYPIPLSIYKLLGQVTHIQYQFLFVPLICTFLFLAALALWLLAKKISGSNLVACLSSLFFVSAYWTFDGLRMGLMPETFGWFILILALYFLVSKNFLWLTIFSLILPLSHPYSFSIFVLVFVLYTVASLIFSAKKDKIFVLKMLGIYALTAALIYLLEPDLIHRFFNFINPEVIGWGERNFFVFFTASQSRRIFLAVFAIVGIVSSFKLFKDEKYKVLFSMLFAGMFMAMNQYFGIRFQVFRFFPYFEMPLAIFAALGIMRIVEIFKLKNKYYYLGAVALSLFIILPQVYANDRVTYGMSKVPENNNSMSVGDEEAIAWIADNVPASDGILAPYKWYLWILAIDSHTATWSNNRFFSDVTGDLSAAPLNVNYIYWPTAVYPLLPVMTANYHYVPVFESEGSIIFRLAR
ncbi:MAG: hypothetical protein WCG99_02645 [Candidatus Berkelbacteria bacterium]